MSINHIKSIYVPSSLTNRREALLLLLAILFVCLSAVALKLLYPPKTTSAQFNTLFIISIILWITLSILGHFLLSTWIPYRDALMFPIMTLLTGWGMITIWRLQGTYAFRYAMWFAISIMCMLTIIRWSQHLVFLEKHPYLSLVAGILITALTVLVGVSPSGIGPKLWLPILSVNFINHSIYFQPSELLKVLIVFFLAAYLSRHRTNLILRQNQNKYSLPAAFLVPLITMWSFMVIIQGDLGAGWLIYWCFLGIFYLRTRRKR